MELRDWEWNCLETNNHSSLFMPKRWEILFKTFTSPSRWRRSRQAWLILIRSTCSPNSFRTRTLACSTQEPIPANTFISISSSCVFWRATFVSSKSFWVFFNEFSVVVRWVLINATWAVSAFTRLSRPFFSSRTWIYFCWSCPYSAPTCLNCWSFWTSEMLDYGYRRVPNQKKERASLVYGEEKNQ